MAYILHIDTSGDTGIVAIGHNGVLISSIANADNRNHAATINLHIDKVLADAGISMQLLDAVAVCGGPGSYTGLRIGLATAKGLCYLLDKPLQMHSKLLLLILQSFYSNNAEYDNYAAILYAREKEYYFASYNNKLNSIIAPQHILEEQMGEMRLQLAGKSLLAGDVDDSIKAVFNENDHHIITENKVDIQSWINYAFEQYNCNSFVNLASAEPFYLKQVYTHKQKEIN